MGLDDVFHFYNYTSDNTGTYQLKLSEAVAAAGGFTLATEVDAPYPYDTKNVRHVLGVDSEGHRTRLPIALPNNALFVGGGQFSLHGRTYEVMGRIGERRANSSIGG